MAVFLKIFGTLVLFLGVMAGVYYITMKTTPARDIFGLMGERGAPEPSLSESDIEKLDKEIIALEIEFRNIIRSRRANDSDLGLLRRALELQGKIVEARGGNDPLSNERRDELKAFYDDQAGLRLLQESQREEQLFEQALKDGLAEESLAHLAEAIHYQAEINRSHGDSRHASLRRLSELERRQRDLLALPVYEASLAAESAARVALEQENWDEAAEHFREAIALQTELNRKSIVGGYANRNRLSELEQDLASLQSRDRAAQIEELLREARRQMESRDFSEAAERFQVALRLQGELNAQHPASRFAGQRRAAEISDLLEQSLSSGLSAEIQSEVAEVDRRLRDGDVVAALADIENLATKVESFRADFPDSEEISAELQEKVDYLSFMRADAGFFQRRIEPQLLPLPGAPSGERMLRTEVNQALYSSIMRSNPSRQSGELLPVESVTYEEALRFCQRLSWLFGRTVRLPRREEVEMAVGSLRYVDLREHSWCLENANGTIQPIATRGENAHGFHDLLGNVREWCQPAGFLSDSEALLAGGSAADSIDRLAEIPFEAVNRRSRNRYSGFRVVFESVLDQSEQAAANIATETPPL